MEPQTRLPYLLHAGIEPPDQTPQATEVGQTPDISVLKRQTKATLTLVERQITELDAEIACIVSDNGIGFTSKAILKWANDNKVQWHYIDPGKPQAPRWGTKPQQQRVGRLNYLVAPRPAHFPHPKPPTIKPEDSCQD